MYRYLIMPSITFIVFIVVACASTQLADPQQDQRAKGFNVDIDKSTIYIYREKKSFLGTGAKFEIRIDGKPVGFNIPGTFVWAKVRPGQHDIWSRTHQDGQIFPPTLYQMKTEKGKIYFLRQRAKSEDFEPVDADIGRQGVLKCSLSQSAIHEREFKIFH